MRKFATILGSLLFVGAAVGQPSKDADMTLAAGDWKVFRSIDKMTDKVNCTAIYKDWNTQAGTEGVYVRIPGGVASVTLRFGDEQALPMRLATKMEKDVGAMIIDGADFARALQTNRIRASVLLLVRGMREIEIDTARLPEVVQHMRDGCQHSTKQQELPAIGECSQAMVRRLNAAGVSTAQIDAGCRAK